MKAIVQGTIITPRPLLYRRVVGFLIAFALIFLLALEGGGYDPVIRHEVALVIWAFIGLGLGSGILPRSQLSRPAALAVGGLTALALLSLVAHAWTESDERTTAEFARVLQYLGIVVLAYLSLNRDSWQGAAAGFATAAIAVTGLAVASRLFPATFDDEVARLLAIDRLSYPLDYWNATACWGAMTIAIAVGWSAHAERLLVRCLLLAVVPVAATAVYLSYSRAGIAASLLAVVAVVALSRYRWTAAANAVGAGLACALPILAVRGHDAIARGTGGDGAGTVFLALLAAAAISAGVAAATGALGADGLRMRRRHAQRLLAAGAICLGLAALALNGPISQAWDEFRNQRTVSLTGSDPTERLGTLGGTRYGIWTAAVDAFSTDPARGVGPGSFEFYWSREGVGTEFVRDAHSLYLEQAAELGLPGIAALLCFLIGALLAGIRARSFWRRDRDMGLGCGLVAAFIVFLFYSGVDWMWEMGAVGSLAFGGIAAAGAGGLPRARPGVLKPWFRYGIAIAAILAAVAQVPTLVSVERTRASDASLSAGELRKAGELADDAVAAEPWGASGYAARAESAMGGGNLDAAADDIADAIEREPTNWRHQLLSARIEAAQGDRPGMKAALTEARRLAPRSPFLVEGSPFLISLDELLADARRARR
jgi:hypothetical protein